MSLAAAVWTVAAYALILVAIHLVATRGTGTLPEGLSHRFGASAGSLAARPWAQLSSPWFHETWTHLGYNLLILGLTMPVALHFFGPRALVFAWLASPLAGFFVNLVILLPLSGVWSYAAAALEPRLVGASVVVFAGAGMAWIAWHGPLPAKIAVVVGFMIYETILAILGVTRPFVVFYHVAGAVLGVGFALAMLRPLSG